LISVSGGRQGCKLGALIFNLIYSVALKRVREELSTLRIILVVRSQSTTAFWAAAGADVSWDSDLLAQGYEQAFEITYVDDEAIHLAATSPKSLMLAIPILMRHLCRTFAYFGFRINWKPGKTECFLVLRGKHADKARAQLVKTADGFSIPLPPECGDVSLRIVGEYKHLGSVIDNVGTALQDVPIRCSAAMVTYSPLAKKVFGAIRIQRAVRMRLFSSLVVSRLIYNVHTWSNITGAMYSKLNSVYMRGLRRIADRLIFSAKSALAAGSDQLVRDVLGAPSLHCLIVQKRLMLVASVLKYAPTHVAAMLASRADNADKQQLPWVRLVIDDLNRLRQFHIHKLAELGSPSVSPADWVHLMTKYPFQWKQLVKNLHYSTSEYDLPRATSTLEQNASVAWKYRCSQCSEAFKSEQGLKQHLRANHKKRTALAVFIGSSSVCPVCLAQFSNRTRLLAHVSDSRNRGSRTLTCHNVLSAKLVAPVSDADLAVAHESDRKLRAQTRKRGRTTPLATSRAKRPRVGTSLAEQQLLYRLLPDAEKYALPSNALQLYELRPRKRLKSKTSQDQVLLHHLAQ
jgi:hypothetical protein